MPAVEWGVIPRPPRKTDAYSDRTQAQPLIEKFKKYDNLLNVENELDTFVNELRATGRKRVRVLEAGCGPGLHLEALAEKGSNIIGKGFKAMGIDSSKLMVEEARKTGCQVQVMDVRKLRFKKNSFNGVWCNAVLSHLNPAGVIDALGEFYNVLRPGRPGGLLFVSTQSAKTASERIDDFGRCFYPMTKESFNELVERAGFEIMRSYERLGWIETFAFKFKAGR